MAQCGLYSVVHHDPDRGRDEREGDHIADDRGAGGLPGGGAADDHDIDAHPHPRLLLLQAVGQSDRLTEGLHPRERDFERVLLRVSESDVQAAGQGAVGWVGDPPPGADHPVVGLLGDGETHHQGGCIRVCLDGVGGHPHIQTLLLYNQMGAL